MNKRENQNIIKEKKLIDSHGEHIKDVHDKHQDELNRNLKKIEDLEEEFDRREKKMKEDYTKKMREKQEQWDKEREKLLADMRNLTEENQKLTD